MLWPLGRYCRIRLERGLIADYRANGKRSAVVTPQLFRLQTATGTLLSVFLPSPSSPLLLKPQQ